MHTGHTSGWRLRQESGTNQKQEAKNLGSCWKSSRIRLPINVIYIYINNICLQIPCVTTGWAGFEGWKVEPEIPLWSPLGLGVTLGEVVTAGFEPMASCCLASWGNFEQHLGQVGFRQANGWDTCWNKLEKKVRAKVVWTFKFFTDYCRYKKNLVLMLWRSRVFSMNLIKKWKPAVPVWMCIIK